LYHSVRPGTGLYGDGDDNDDDIYHNNIKNKENRSSVTFN